MWAIDLFAKSPMKFPGHLFERLRKSLRAAQARAWRKWTLC